MLSVFGYSLTLSAAGSITLLDPTPGWLYSASLSSTVLLDPACTGYDGLCKLLTHWEAASEDIKWCSLPTY